MTDLNTIAAQFCDTATLVNIAPLGNGLINDTYLVSSSEAQWVLQRINQTVFAQPLLIMENLQRLAEHLSQKPVEQVKLQVPALLRTSLDAMCYVNADSECWRATTFVDKSYSKDLLESSSDAQQIGWALGHFHRLCSDLDPDTLNDTLPGFHITPHYLTQYQQALSANKTIADDLRFSECVEFILTHSAVANSLENAKQQGDLKLRVTHGDPKVNNFLFDQYSHKIVSLIDLDTVKPALIHYDIGDCLRSSCHNTDTDTFELEVCEIILRSYLHETREFFTPADFQYLYPAIELIPFELGLRFFTDYLNGNRYFKVNHPKQNLGRALEQFKLCQSIQKQRSAIEAIVDALK